MTSLEEDITGYKDGATLLAQRRAALLSGKETRLEIVPLPEADSYIPFLGNKQMKHDCFATKSDSTAQTNRLIANKSTKIP